MPAKEPDMQRAYFVTEMVAMNVVGMNPALFVGGADITDKKMYQAQDM